MEGKGCTLKVGSLQTQGSPSPWQPKPTLIEGLLGVKDVPTPSLKLHNIPMKQFQPFSPLSI